MFRHRYRPRWKFGAENWIEKKGAYNQLLARFLKLLARCMFIESNNLKYSAMKTIIHSIVTLVPALGLASYTAYSAVTAGINADSTVVAFSFLAIVGIIETEILSLRQEPESITVEAGSPDPRPGPAVVPVDFAEAHRLEARTDWEAA